mgnify:CR=1 FL=1
MRKFLTTTAILGLTAGSAMAQSMVDQLVEGYLSQGYTRIEVSEGPNQIKVEAIQGDTKIEVIYDATTGEIIKQEVERVDGDDDTSPGVEIDREDEDFIDDDEDDDD